MLISKLERAYVTYDDGRRLACICHAMEAAKDMDCVIFATIAGVELKITKDSKQTDLFEKLLTALEKKEKLDNDKQQG